MTAYFTLTSSTLENTCKIYLAVIWMPPGQIWSELILSVEFLSIKNGIPNLGNYRIICGHCYAK